MEIHTNVHAGFAFGRETFENVRLWIVFSFVVAIFSWIGDIIVLPNLTGSWGLQLNEMVFTKWLWMSGTEL
jgi:hypothetical protein